VFPENFVEKLLDKYLDAYEKLKETCIEKIEEVNDEDL